MNHHNFEIAVESLSVEYLVSGDNDKKTTPFSPPPFHPCQHAVLVSLTTDIAIVYTRSQRNVKCFSFYRHFRIAELG